MTYSSVLLMHNAYNSRIFPQTEQTAWYFSSGGRPALHRLASLTTSVLQYHTAIWVQIRGDSAVQFN